MAVLFSVGSIAIAIFEIESEVFHGFALKLLDDAGVDHRRGGSPDSHGCSESVRVSAILLQHTKRRRAETRRRVRPEQMRAAIDCVDGLSTMGQRLHARELTRLESPFQWRHPRSAVPSIARRDARRSPGRRCTWTMLRRQAC